MISFRRLGAAMTSQHSEVDGTTLLSHGTTIRLSEVRVDAVGSPKATSKT